MKYAYLTLSIALIAITASCSKYGPEQDPAAQTPSAPEAATPAPAQSEPLKDDVAVVYNLPAITSVLRCDLNSVAGVGLTPGVEAPLAQAAGIVFNGWVADEQGIPPAKLVIVLKGQTSYGIQVATGADRPDVAEALKSEAAAKSGIAALADTSAVAMGTYQVHLVVPETGAGCDTGKLLRAGG